MNKCPGCGARLQNVDPNFEGYIKNNDVLCDRCFRIQNYNEYHFLEKDNNKFIDILKEINKTNDLVLLVVDLFDFENLSLIKKYLNNDILLVLTKRDLLPKKIYNERILNYFNELNIKDKIIISSNKNYNFDELLDNINKYKKSKNVYVVGYTNAGKSTMINKLIYNYSNELSLITTSSLPSTTLNTIEIKLDDNLILNDTPGILKENSILDIVDEKMYKKIIPKKEIRPIIIQIKNDQTILIENLIRIDVSKGTDLIFYMSNNLEIKRYHKNLENLKNLKEHTMNIKGNEDLIINGLGFIKITKNATIDIYVDEKVGLSLRKSFI